jgi:hypothetical protein
VLPSIERAINILRMICQHFLQMEVRCEQNARHGDNYPKDSDRCS